MTEKIRIRSRRPRQCNLLLQYERWLLQGIGLPDTDVASIRDSDEDFFVQDIIDFDSIDRVWLKVDYLEKARHTWLLRTVWSSPTFVRLCGLERRFAGERNEVSGVSKM